MLTFHIILPIRFFFKNNHDDNGFSFMLALNSNHEQSDHKTAIIFFNNLHYKYTSLHCGILFTLAKVKDK